MVLQKQGFWRGEKTKMKFKIQNCQNCKNDFIIEPDDFAFYEKIKVPPPSFCPECRRIRRLSWRNDTTLYSRKCFLCDKDFVSIYAPNTNFKVLCPKCFHGDDWDPYSYGVDYDPLKSFIEQFIEMYKNMPVLGIINDNDIASINCLYTNDVAFSKNCSMVFIAWRLENVFNSSNLAAGRDLSDCMCVLEDSSYTYDGVFIDNVANCKSIYWSSNCMNCYFGYDLRGCSDCFMCFGLRNKKYYFKNKQYTKDEYNTILDSYDLHTRNGYKKAKEEFQDFLKDKPRKFAEMRNCTDCTGSDMIRSKNTKNSVFASYSEDSRYVHEGVSFKSCYDCAVGGETELSYECITPDHSYNSIVTIESWKNNHIAYCIDCHASQYLLGCVGLKKGEYSILNKKYNKDEFLKLKDQIVSDMKKRGEWGEFLPSKYSPFGINETDAFYDLKFSKEESIKNGYNWQDNIQKTKGKETLDQKDVPNSIKDVKDNFTEEVLECMECERNYKIIPDELLLYKRLLVPIPERCFFCRHSDRKDMRGGFELIDRNCNKCQKDIETVFSAKEKRPICCESCYQKELI